MKPERLGQDVERSLQLRQVDACGETVRRNPLGWRDDRLGAILAHAAQDEIEQLPHVTAALLRGG